MSKQTAVQQAINRIKELQNSINSSSQQIALAQAMDILEEHKPIFEQQIIDAYVKGANNQIYGVDLSGLEYYNNTFNK
jgi:vacuolar-type H+-ATPase subunit D/Vma8